MALGLHRFLRQLQLNTKRTISSQSYTAKPPPDVFSRLVVPLSIRHNNKDLRPNSNINFTPRSLDFDSNITNNGVNISKIIKCPILTNLEIIEPPKSVSVDNVEDFPTSSVQLPPMKENEAEKRAERMIVVRRKKMKKHKLKKLRKKMKYEWAKVRQKREMRKEKAFQAELLAQIAVAEQFDAEKYVMEKLEKSKDRPVLQKQRKVFPLRFPHEQPRTEQLGPVTK
ncbi:uncharacterized protein LOC124409694 [Diprion similis]|uniref:uncharacterized protein LOC124409694 n=1 Tax=Diprion similis TaxID=362088 RepID=UPI001EF92FC8|nr:uncharacterized protein LOC124409694 [Diprion similis]